MSHQNSRQGKGRQTDREQGPAKHGALKPSWEDICAGTSSLPLARNHLAPQTDAIGAFSKEHPQI